ncbi:MAG: hypothetical protein JNM17_22985 [Archangium sp.]|nr:hypothetical protein [Archangium sp.]
MLEVSAHATVTDRKLEGAAHALRVAGLPDLERQLDKARELHRLFAARLTVILRGLSQSEPR